MKHKFALAVCALASIALAPAASADEARCSTANLRGSYSFQAQGFTVAGSPVPSPLQGPFASAGTAAYDGRGNVILTATAVFNGLSQALPPVKGTYTVNPDCTFTSKLENGATFYAAIVANASQLYVLQTTPGVIASGIATSQSSRDAEEDGDRFAGCPATIYRGSYGFISTGFAGPPAIAPPAAGPLAGVGTVSFDPRGTFKLTAVRSANGIIDPAPLTLTGRFTVNGNCTFQMTFDVGFHFNAVIADGGRQIDFIETDPGTTFAVKARKM